MVLLTLLQICQAQKRLTLLIGVTFIVFATLFTVFTALCQVSIVGYSSAKCLTAQLLFPICLFYLLSVAIGIFFLFRKNRFLARVAILRPDILDCSQSPDRQKFTDFYVTRHGPEKELLNTFSNIVNPKIVICGPSGSGKSTLVANFLETVPPQCLPVVVDLSQLPSPPTCLEVTKEIARKLGLHSMNVECCQPRISLAINTLVKEVESNRMFLLVLDHVAEIEIIHYVTTKLNFHQFVIIYNGYTMMLPEEFVKIDVKWFSKAETLNFLRKLSINLSPYDFRLFRGVLTNQSLPIFASILARRFRSLLSENKAGEIIQFIDSTNNDQSGSVDKAIINFAIGGDDELLTKLFAFLLFDEGYIISSSDLAILWRYRSLKQLNEVELHKTLSHLEHTGLATRLSNSSHWRMHPLIYKILLLIATNRCQPDEGVDDREEGEERKLLESQPKVSYEYVKCIISNSWPKTIQRRKSVFTNLPLMYKSEADFFSLNLFRLCLDLRRFRLVEAIVRKLPIAELSRLLSSERSLLPYMLRIDDYLSADSNDDFLLSSQELSDLLVARQIFEKQLELVEFCISQPRLPDEVREAIKSLALDVMFRENSQYTTQILQEILLIGIKSNLPAIFQIVLEGLRRTSKTKLFEEYTIKKVINSRNIGRKGQTLLIQACLSNNPEFVRILLEYGADVNETDWQGLSVLGSALLMRPPCDVAIIEMLLQSEDIDVDAEDRNGDSVLMTAVDNSDLSTSVFVLLLDKNADLEYKNPKSNYETPFLRSCRKAPLATVELLLKRNPSMLLKDTDGQGRNALMIAAERTELPCEKTILEFLVSEVISSNTLKEKRRQVAQVDPGGETLLMKAAKARCLQNIEFLLEQSEIDVAARATSGRQSTALLLAIDYSETEEEATQVIGLLLNHLGRNNKAAIDLGHAESGRTPLISASSKIWPDVVAELCEVGATVNLVDGEGNTALMAALIASERDDTDFSKLFEVVRKLLLNNSDVEEIKNKKEQTAWQLAERNLPERDPSRKKICGGGGGMCIELLARNSSAFVAQPKRKPRKSVAIRTPQAD